ncbi:TPA: ThiF family adenylyltransferase, partial [Listeria innocua]
GSVNSYIIKQLAGHGLNDVVLVDDDTIEVDNMYRHAFPYISKKKIDAAEHFIKSTFVTSSVTKFEVKIESDSEDYLEHVDTVYVSVDNYISWFNVIGYLLQNIQKEMTIIFSGVDIFGGFGKFSKFHLKTDNKSEFIKWALSFLEFVPPEGIERRQMIGNGCGKSIAIYSELDLIILANNISNNTEVGEVMYVPFGI